MQRIVVIGSGFAGMWSALSAARLLDAQQAGDRIEVVVVSPMPTLVVRPRLYEANPGAMTAPLLPLFAACGIRYKGGIVDRVDVGNRDLSIVTPNGDRTHLAFDALVLASGSCLFRPAIPGLQDHAFSVDQLDDAAELEAHLACLAQRPQSQGRDTVVVVGGGFTGLEIATELPARLSAILGPQARPRTLIIEREGVVGPELGPGPRPVIEQALASQGVELRLACGVTAIRADGVVTTAGDTIASETVIWTAGMRASPLAAQIAADRDLLGRLEVDRYLRVPSAPKVIATGDVAHALTDEQGHYAMMSCQHALIQGRVAGHNAAAALLGLDLTPYVQEAYRTTLDLGPWGAVHSEGWDRRVTQTGAEAKVAKRYINSQFIYPPIADRRAAFQAADPTWAAIPERERRAALSQG